ncbi:hypothetical protein OOZ63_01440 [Paucibacter sp. PLA-PC-4]|uniref:hypothetical protein n=1 Tax=Paucibacter sp. PLA-PC-4 TaxID=2993655 RepID=UPI002248E1EC|nr:hypothetical protein [Paucibacter sp. PLA-PC-4]MCX2860502.1 hypothetical protein [Paucibacter sp. PLA-PC-4]
MKVLVLGASKGLGCAIVEALVQDGDTVIGVSPSRPVALSGVPGVAQEWIIHELSDPRGGRCDRGSVPGGAGRDHLQAGLWESRALLGLRLPGRRGRGPDRADEHQHGCGHHFAQASAAPAGGAAKLHIILTRSTSGQPGSGRPEGSFDDSKHALHGRAEALREALLAQRLAVICLQLGYLSAHARCAAADRGAVEPVGCTFVK